MLPNAHQRQPADQQKHAGANVGVIHRRQQFELFALQFQPCFPGEGQVCQAGPQRILRGNLAGPGVKLDLLMADMIAHGPYWQEQNHGQAQRHQAACRRPPQRRPGMKHSAQQAADPLPQGPRRFWCCFCCGGWQQVAQFLADGVHQRDDGAAHQRMQAVVDVAGKEQQRERHRHQHRGCPMACVQSPPQPGEHQRQPHQAESQLKMPAEKLADDAAADHVQQGSRHPRQTRQTDGLCQRPHIDRRQQKTQHNGDFSALHRPQRQHRQAHEGVVQVQKGVVEQRRACPQVRIPGGQMPNARRSF